MDMDTSLLALTEAKHKRAIIEHSLKQSKERLDQESQWLLTEERDLQGLKAKREERVHSGAALRHHEAAYKEAVDAAADIDVCLGRAAVKIEMAKVRVTKAREGYQTLQVSLQRAQEVVRLAAKRVYSAKMEALAMKVMESRRTWLVNLGELKAMQPDITPSNWAAPSKLVEEELRFAPIPNDLHVPVNILQLDKATITGKSFDQIIDEIVASGA